MSAVLAQMCAVNAVLTTPHRQTFFEGHDDDVTCVAVSPGLEGVNDFVDTESELIGECVRDMGPRGNGPGWKAPRRLCVGLFAAALVARARLQ